MANLNNPYGLRSLGITLSGGSPSTIQLAKAAGYATAIFRGDAVHRVADGSIESASATPGNTLYSGVSANFGAASTATVHTIYDDPTTLFHAQADGSLVEADMGLNANLVLTAGNATTKISKHQINSATEAVTATLDVKLLRKVADPINEWGNYVRLVVVFNKHRMNPGVVGV